MFRKDEHAKVRLDVNEVIEEVLTLLRGELNSRRVSVRTELSQELPRISADRVQLQQVVLNLVMNAGEAMDAMPAGARILTIRSEACAPNEVIIAVEDSGPGIDPKDVDHIFDPFFTTKSQGMGMGLSICRSIIKGASRSTFCVTWYHPGRGLPDRVAIKQITDCLGPSSAGRASFMNRPQAHSAL